MSKQSNQRYRKELEKDSTKSSVADIKNRNENQKQNKINHEFDGLTKDKK